MMDFDVAIALSDAEVKHSISLAEAAAIELAHGLAHGAGLLLKVVSFQRLIRFDPL